MNGQQPYNAMPQNRGYNALADDRNMQLMRIRDQIERERRYGSMSQGTRPMNLAENAAYAGKELTGMNAINRGYQTVRDFRGEHGIMNPATMGDYAKANVGLAGNALEATMAGMDMGALAGPSGRMASNAIEQAIKSNPGLFPDTQAGMVAWHGSPHKFPATETNPLGEFDLGKMGSGEGAQAYGWGTYLAEHPETAKFYSEAGMDVTPRLRMAIDDNGGNVADTIKALRKSDPHNLLAEAEAVKGNLYEVDLPDTEIGKMLDWDKPFSTLPDEQKKLFAGFEGIGSRERNEIWDELELIATNDSKIYDKWYSADLGDATNRLVDGELTNADRKLINDTFKEYKKDYEGKTILTALEQKHGKTVGDAYRSASSFGAKTNADFGIGQERLSKELRDAGIPGIKFLDQASRGAGEGTRNFVVFDPKKAKITGRN